jgi:predicted nucleic acid-binding protein
VIAYLDSSALVKCYAMEARSLDTIDLIGQADMVVTSPVTRVEVASGLARAVRMGSLSPRGAHAAYADFAGEVDAIIQVPLTDAIVTRGQALVWEHGLRGYDAIQLASALAWQQRMGSRVTLATFDTRLARAAGESGLTVWPPQPPGA